jgi:GAF domain-containing protein
VLERLEARQVLVSDRGADAAEVELLRREGFGALLMVPIVVGGQAIGLLEAKTCEERPWSRSDVHWAHTIACQLASVVHALTLASRGSSGGPWRRPHAA